MFQLFHKTKLHTKTGFSEFLSSDELEDNKQYTSVANHQAIVALVAALVLIGLAMVLAAHASEATSLFVALASLMSWYVLAKAMFDRIPLEENCRTMEPDACLKLLNIVEASEHCQEIKAFLAKVTAVRPLFYADFHQITSEIAAREKQAKLAAAQAACVTLHSFTADA